MVDLMLLDTSSLAYRAFFALPTSIAADDGQPVNAVRGYLDMTARLLSDHAPRRVVHVFDDEERPADRVAAFPGYKQARNTEPEELTVQFDVLRRVLAAFGQTGVRAPGWEADDAIGVLCTSAEPDERVAIVTGDRDLLQLVRDAKPEVLVLSTVKGVSDLAVYDEAAVVAKYGVRPDRYVDYATLRGDPSDGLPGVKGVGEKTARALVATAPSIEALLDAPPELTPRVARALQASREYLSAMRQVVPVRTDVALDWMRGDRDDAALDRLGERWNLQGPIGRLRAALDA